MLIDLSEILSLNGEVKNLIFDFESDKFDTGHSIYPFTGECQCICKFIKQQDKKIYLSSSLKAGLIIPCDRCLKDVVINFNFSDEKEIDISENFGQHLEELNEMPYIDGFSFDSEKYIHNELMLNMPVKVLCNENCKGICQKCGKNLNEGECHCDTTDLDPRMSKVLDVFNQFKEV